MNRHLDSYYGDQPEPSACDACAIYDKHCGDCGECCEPCYDCEANNHCGYCLCCDDED